MIVGIAYLGAPLVVKLTGGMSTDGTWKVVGTTLEGLPESVAGYLSESIAVLETLRFVFEAIIINSKTTANQCGYIATFVDPRTRDHSTAVVILGYQKGRWKAQTRYVEFSTVFEDGTKLDTNNSKVPSVFMPDPDKTVLQFRLRDPL